jgi:hypothetical protein
MIEKELCVVCGKQATEWEPRFNYFTCAEHSSVPPVNIRKSSKTDYQTFYYKFKNALHTRKLDSYLIYDDEAVSWFKKNNMLDLAAEAENTLQTRSYPEELDHWVKLTLKYLYDTSIEKVDASVKHIPSCLLK